MNELSRHIEILLLDNDCVIVPGFGGFMAHHSSAMYLDDAGMFYPPQRTIGFNPQLQLNDSVLAQSYVEAYDISYPEAVRKIETEVDAIRQKLSSEGSCSFNGIGTITLQSDGKYDFEPCMAGLLTPSLYALDSFAIDPISSDAINLVQPIVSSLAEEEKPATITIDTTDDAEIDEEEGIHIKYTTIRNVLMVAMTLFFIVFSSIPVGIGSGSIQKCSIIDTEFISSIITSKSTVEKITKQPTAVNPDLKPSKVAEKSSDNESEDNKLDSKESTNTNSQVESSHYFTIVLASNVSKKGANDYVSYLGKKGMSLARVYGERSSRKVIYGNYRSQQEAHDALNKLKTTNDEVAEAWITEIK